MTFIFTAILKNKEFYSHVAHTQGQNSFSSTVRQLVSETIEEHFLANKFGKHEKYSLLTAKWIADFYAMSLTYILMSWIERDMDIPPEDMVNILLENGHRKSGGRVALRFYNIRYLFIL